MIYAGSISTVWPLFGTGNQLLATIALAVTTTFLVNMGKTRYALITSLPVVFVGVYLDSALMAVFVVGMVLVLIDAARRCWKTLRGAPLPEEAFAALLRTDLKMGCC